MLDRVSNKVDFPAMEEEILRFWDERGIFEASIRQRAEAPDYVFYDGPPFATGLPHYGHLLAGTIKDIVPRYWTMRGYRVERRFGWDCHGLPIEALAQEQLGLAGAAAIAERGVDTPASCEGLRGGGRIRSEGGATGSGGRRRSRAGWRCVCTGTGRRTGGHPA